MLASPKTPARLPATRAAEALAALLEAPDRATPTGMRDRALLELLYATGARVSEISALDLGGLDLAQGQITVMGKGAKERIVPLHRIAVERLRDYLAHGRPRAGQTPARRTRSSSRPWQRGSHRMPSVG